MHGGRWTLLYVQRHMLVVLILIAISLLLGVLGYRVFEDMEWIDAFVNACMILGGMGPFGPYRTTAGKVFGGLYALYSGLFFIALVASVLALVFSVWQHNVGLQSLTQRRR